MHNGEVQSHMINRICGGGRSVGFGPPPLIPRILLILLKAKNSENTGLAHVQYTAGISVLQILSYQPRLPGPEVAASVL